MSIGGLIWWWDILRDGSALFIRRSTVPRVIDMWNLITEKYSSAWLQTAGLVQKHAEMCTQMRMFASGTQYRPSIYCKQYELFRNMRVFIALKCCKKQLISDCLLTLIIIII